MANKGFNGSTVNFPSTSSGIGALRGASYSNSCAEVSVTGSTFAAQAHVKGIPKKDVTLDLVGASTVTAGSTGSLSVSWFDGTSTSLGKVIVVSKDIKGQMDGEITTSIKVTKTTT
ncbi:MAG: hypothetical protein WC390_11305 [Sulfurimonas sp.]|jgi:hypothetical protein